MSSKSAKKTDLDIMMFRMWKLISLLNLSLLKKVVYRKTYLKMRISWLSFLTVASWLLGVRAYEMNSLFCSMLDSVPVILLNLSMKSLTLLSRPISAFICLVAHLLEDLGVLALELLLELLDRKGLGFVPLEGPFEGPG